MRKYYVVSLIYGLCVRTVDRTCPNRAAGYVPTSYVISLCSKLEDSRNEKGEAKSHISESHQVAGNNLILGSGDGLPPQKGAMYKIESPVTSLCSGSHPPTLPSRQQKSRLKGSSFSPAGSACYLLWWG